MDVENIPIIHGVGVDPNTETSEDASQCFHDFHINVKVSSGLVCSHICIFFFLLTKT